MSEYTDLWDKLSAELSKAVGEDNFSLWFKPVYIRNLNKDILELSVPNKVYEDWITNHFAGELSVVAGKILGKNTEITYHREKELVPPEPLPEETLISAVPEQPKQTDQGQFRFNPAYTFENFVVGESNKFARAAAESICRDPGMSYNPLTIYGGVGLGKTHLLHAIGNLAKKNFPSFKILYTGSQVLGNEIMEWMKNGKLNAFFSRFGTLDLLLIDDIQFLGSGEFLQQSFFQMFNVMYNNHKQIVLASDRHPQEIPKLEERLKSRFLWGVLTDVKPPDIETRIAILRKKADQEKIFVPDDVILFIASRIKSNIRLLENSLTTLVAHSSLIGSTISIDLAKELLKTLKDEDDNIGKTILKISLDRIKEVVARNFKLNVVELTGKSRKAEIADARQLAMFIARQLTNKSTIEIGHEFGGRDHSTVLYAEEKIRDKIASNLSYNQFANRIMNEIKGI